MLIAALQRKLDDRLERLLHACANESVSHGELAVEARHILDDYTHPPGNPIRGGEYLLPPGWEERWNPSISQWLNFSTLWDEKVARDPGDPLAAALDEAIFAMMRFTLDSSALYFQKKYRRELVMALSDYLARQGYAVDDEATSTGENQKPSWNRKKRTVYCHGREIKRVRSLKVAKNVVLILDAFQEEGWPDRIDSPLPDDPKTLHDTITSLNRNLISIKFTSDGDG